MISPMMEAAQKLPYHGSVQILPEGGHEVRALLAFVNNGKTHIIGDVHQDVQPVPEIMVLLGTRVSDDHPSCVGFRVLYRTTRPKTNSGSIEDNYHIESYKLEPSLGTVSYSQVTDKQAYELKTLRLSQQPDAQDLKVPADNALYRMDFTISDTNGFKTSRHGPPLRTYNTRLVEIEDQMPFIVYASEISLYFIADNLLIKHLDQAIEHDCVGAVPASWKTPLDQAIAVWPHNVQTQMVCGSTDVLNVLLHAMREDRLTDGEGTSVQDRTEAMQFKNFVGENYKSVRPEAGHKAYPIMLDVCEGSCMELPFGGSMLNRTNTYAAVNTLHNLLRANIPASRISFVTLYPAQVQAYKDALVRCHHHLPQAGYDLIQVNLFEESVQKPPVGVAIVDIVRTSNASGNLGYLSQSNRLKAVLSLHCNGLILVGSRICTKNSKGAVMSTKLEKVLQWFVDHGRLVKVSKKGFPIATENTTTNFSSAAATPSIKAPTAENESSMIIGPLPRINDIQSSQTRKYVGIPGLENRKIQNAPISKPAPSPPKATSVSSSSSVHPTSQRKYRGLPGLEHVKIEKPEDEKAHSPISLGPVSSDPVRANDSRLKQGSSAGVSSSTSVHEGPVQRSYDPWNDAVRKAMTPHKVKTSLAPQPANDLVNDTARNAVAPHKLKMALTSPPTRDPVEETVRTAVAPHKVKTPLAPQPARDSVPPAEINSLTESLAKAFKTVPSLNEDKMNQKQREVAVKASAEKDTNENKLTEKPTKSTNVRRRLPDAVIRAFNSPSVNNPLNSTEPIIFSSDNQSQAASPDKAKLQSNIDLLADKSTFPQANIGKENSQVRMIAEEANMQAFGVKKENVAPSFEFKPKPKPPHLRHSTPNTIDDALSAAAKKRDLEKAAVPPHKIQAPLPSSKVQAPLPSSKVQAPLPSPAPAKPRSQATNPPSTPAITAPLPSPALSLPASTSTTSQPQDFKSRYQPKYKNLRARFANLEPEVTRDKGQEDRLFCCLVDAIMDEDEAECDRAYMELLEMLSRVQTSVIRRKEGKA